MSLQKEVPDISTLSVSEKKGFTYVFIPADTDQPMEERRHFENVGLENDSFIRDLKDFYSKTAGAVDDDVLKKQIEARSKTTIDAATMAALQHVTSIDIFPVLMPLAQTKFHGVSCYVDDKGISKNLPLNRRLTSLVQAAGYTQNIFHGDAFIGKVFDDQDAWERIDFNLSECSSDAPWIQLSLHQRKNAASAGAQNKLSDMKAQLANNPQIAMNGMPAPDAMGGQLEAGNAANISIGDEENYSWRDSNQEEMEVTFKYSKDGDENAAFTKKDVKVNFPVNQTKPLVVSIAGKELLSAELFHGVQTDECTWSIVDKKLVVTLMKKQEGKWRSLLKK